MCYTLWYRYFMTDVTVAEGPTESPVDAPVVEAVVQRRWVVVFLNDTTVTVEADEFRIDPSAQTVELQAGGEVVFTAPRANVLFVQRVAPS